jgi:tRNA(Met) C34 N-acetyltransferase TmcA
VQIEGGLSDNESDLISQIASGERRVPGHLVAQNLCTSYSIPNFMTNVSWRVSRIAVRHRLQGQGLGTYLLNAIENSAKNDSMVVSLQTSFGVTSELFRFWHQNGFHFIKAGMRVDTSSGKHSIIMVKPLSTAYTQQLRALIELRLIQLNVLDLKETAFIELIKESLESDYARPIRTIGFLPLSDFSQAIIERQLQDFIEGKRSFNLSIPAIHTALTILLETGFTKHRESTQKNIIEASIKTLDEISNGHLSKQDKAKKLYTLKAACKQLVGFFQQKQKSSV